MFVDVETIVRDFLGDRVDVPVRTRVPKPRPKRFIRAWRTGGAAVNRILDRPLITVQVWDEEDDARASALANECRDYLLGASTGMNLVRRVEEVSGVYYDPDPDTGIHRYSFTHQLSVRATF